METSTLTLYLEGYLVQFLTGYLCGTGNTPLHVRKDCFLGQLLYDQLETVPEDCVYKPSSRTDKKPLLVEVGWLGTTERKRPSYYYYLPRTKQLFIEKHVMIVFDEILCTFLSSVHKATEMQTKLLIEQFCDRYNIDFATYYETLKKKYYRHQKNLCSCVP